MENVCSSDLKEAMKNRAFTSKFPHRTCTEKMQRNGQLELARIISYQDFPPHIQISLSDNETEYFLNA